VCVCVRERVDCPAEVTINLEVTSTAHEVLYFDIERREADASSIDVLYRYRSYKVFSLGVKVISGLLLQTQILN